MLQHAKVYFYATASGKSRFGSLTFKTFVCFFPSPYILRTKNVNVTGQHFTKCVFEALQKMDEWRDLGVFHKWKLEQVQ